jgi:hypothetical protein
MEKYSTKIILAEISKLSFLARFSNFKDVLYGNPKIVKDLLDLPVKWNMDFVYLKGGTKVKSISEALNVEEAWETYIDKKGDEQEGLSEVGIEGEFEDTPVKAIIKFQYSNNQNPIDFYIKDEGEYVKMFTIGSMSKLKTTLNLLEDRMDISGYDLASLWEKIQKPESEKKLKDFIENLMGDKKLDFKIKTKKDDRPARNYRAVEYQIIAKDNLDIPKLKELIEGEDVKESIKSFVTGVLKLSNTDFRNFAVKEFPQGFRIVIQANR